MNYERGRKWIKRRNERRWRRDWGRMWRRRRELLSRHSGTNRVIILQGSDAPIDKHS